MTAVWDIFQEFLESLSEIKNDPELYRTGLQYVKNVIDDIHEYDHLNKEPVSRYLARRSKYWAELLEMSEKFRRGKENQRTV